MPGLGKAGHAGREVTYLDSVVSRLGRQPTVWITAPAFGAGAAATLPLGSASVGSASAFWVGFESDLKDSPFGLAARC